MATKDRSNTNLLDNLPEVAAYRLVQSPDGAVRFEYLSSGFEELTGYPASLVLEQPWAFFLMTHEDDVPMVIAEREKARVERRVLDTAFRVKRADGMTRWIRARARPTFAEDGTVIWDGTYIDETHHTLIQDALRESESRFRAIADDSPVLIWMSDESGDCTYFNKTWLEFSGRTLQQEIGMGWLESVHPDDKERVIRIYLTAFAARRPFEMEYRLRRHDGEYRWIADRGRPRACASNGQFLGYIGSCADFTARKVAEDSVRASEEHLREAQEIAKIGSWVHDVATGREKWSEQMCRLFGRDPADNTPSITEFFEYVHAEDAPRLLALCERAKALAMQYKCDFRITRHDGSVAHIRSNAKVRQNSHGRVVELYGTCQDITEQVLAEQERKQLQERLDSAQRLESLGLLAGGIAHDFNNMLMGVLGEASVLARSAPAGSTLANSLSTIQEAATRMAELTNQLLAYSGRGQFVVERVDPNAIVASMLELVVSNLHPNASLESEISREPATMEIDSSQLRHVVMNLILNAADALHGKSGRIALRTHVEQADGSAGTWTLEVTDSGAGMSADVRKRIFDPFFTTKENNRGLGMSTVHGIVQRSKGQIDVRSEPGCGTTVSVRFPLARATHTDNARLQPHTSSPLLPMRILVADDEAMVRRSIRRMLELCNANVVEVADGAAAIEALNHGSTHFDLLLLDVVMPRKSGYEVLAEVRQRHPSLKVILMSGYNAPSSIANTNPTDRAPDAALQKPFAWIDLEQAMHAVFGPEQPVCP